MLRINLNTITFSLFFCAATHLSFMTATTPWVRIFHREIRPADFTVIDRTNVFSFLQPDTIPFTQLLFAWNGVRPTAGYFSFYVQIRDKEDKKYGTWHHMMDWGKKVQKSYMSQSDGKSSFHHVRLQVDQGRLADGFRIRITAKEGADLKDLHAITITLANYNNFVSEDKARLASRMGTSVTIQSMPAYSQFSIDHQDKHRMCSPTACAMVIDYIHNKKLKEPKKVAKKVFDEGLNAYGSWPFNTAHVYECCSKKYWIFPTRLSSFIEIYNQLKRGLPVVVSVRGELPNAPSVYSHGHLLVVTGYDSKNQKVIVNDPAFTTDAQTVFSYPLAAFVDAWERSHRLTYWLLPKRKGARI